MYSNSDEFDKNSSIRNKIISIDDVLIILRNKHELNLKLNNKCNKLLKKYLEVIEENLIVKKKYEELQQSFGGDLSSNTTLKKEYDNLNIEFQKIQQNHFEYVNSSELKYQSACRKINDLEKELEVSNLQRNSKNILKSTKLANELQETKKLFEEFRENFVKLDKVRKDDLKQIAALKLEREKLTSKSNAAISPQKHKLKKVKQLQIALAEKENELEILNLAHDKDIEAIKNRYGKEIQKLQQTKFVSESITIGTQMEPIKHNQKLKSTCTQTQIDNEKFEYEDVKDILKEMTCLPTLMPPLTSSDENEASIPKDNPVKMSPKLRVKNRFSRIVKRNKIRKNQLKTVTKILGFRRKNVTKNTPLVFIPKNCEVKSLSEFLQSESDLCAKYYTNYNFSNPFGAPNIFNPYYSYNPMCAQMYPCPPNFCCSQTPCYYQNYIPRPYQQPKRGKRNLMKSLDELSPTPSMKPSKFNKNNFIKTKSLSNFKTECFSNQNSDADDFFDSAKKRKRIIVYSSDEISDTELSFDGKKNSETTFAASTISNKNIQIPDSPKNDTYTSSNLSTIVLTSSFEIQSPDNLESTEKPLEPIKINLAPHILNSTLQYQNNSANCVESTVPKSDFTDKLNQTLDAVVRNEVFDISKLDSLCPKTFDQPHNVVDPKIYNLMVITHDGQEIPSSFALSSDNAQLHKNEYSNCNIGNFNCDLDIKNSKNLVQHNETLTHNLENNNEISRLEDRLILPCGQSDLSSEKANLESSVPDKVLNSKTTVLDSNLELNSPELEITAEPRNSSSDISIKISSKGSDKNEPVVTTQTIEVPKIVSKPNLSSLSQIRRSMRLQDKTNLYLSNKCVKKVTAPINNSFTNIKNVEIPNLIKLDENKLEMLGFSTEEISNETEKRAAFILRDVISKYETSLLNSSIQTMDNLYRDIPISKDDNKIEAPAFCDLVTLHKQKRRVAHRTNPIKRMKNLSSRQQNLLNDLFDSSEQTMENSHEERLIKGKNCDERSFSGSNLKTATLDRKQRTVEKFGGETKRTKSFASSLTSPLNHGEVRNYEQRVFKRPEKSKYVVIPDTPKSPDFMEYVKEDPKIIPLKKVTSIKMKTITKHVDNLLNKDLDEEKYKIKVQLLAKQEADKIARAIIEVTSLDLSQECDSTFTPLAPLLTKTQQKAIVLVNKLLEFPGQEDLPELILIKLEERILLDDRLDYLLIHTRLYVGLAMIYFSAEKVRLLCVNAVCKLGDYFLPFMFLILTMYPEVLPTKEKLAGQTAIDQCLPRVLVRIIRHRYCTKPGFNCNNLKILLNQFYGYSSDAENEDSLMEELVKLYIESCSKIVYTAIILLCKNFPNNWTHQQINKYFIPLVNKNLLNSNCIELVVLTIHMITRLVQPFFYDHSDKNNLQSVLDWLQGFLEVNNTLPFAIRTAISICCVQLSRKPLYETENMKGQKKKGKKKASKKKPNKNSQQL